jgi:8-oxo-dGTP diphosphatase
MTRQVHAAGGVVWRPGQIVIVHRPRYDDWSLPKGKLSPGEHPLAAAVREVEEETGVRAGPQVRLPTVRYLTGTPDVEKVVDFWTMRCLVDHGMQPTDEVDQVCWVDPTQALAKLSYAHDRGLVSTYARLPEVTAVVVLLRHASAGERGSWPGPDDQRPLDQIGRADAEKTATLLLLFAPDQVVSATPVRCVQTVQPLAEKLGRQVELDARFNEDADPLMAAAALRELATAHSCCVVCSQGQLIPPAIAALSGDSHRDRQTPKGTGWVLSFAGTDVVAADRFDPRVRPVADRVASA